MMIYVVGAVAGALMSYAIQSIGPLTVLSFVVMVIAAFCTGFTISAIAREATS